MKCLMTGAILSAGALWAQMPPGWNEPPRLGEDIPQGEAWYGAGLWSADRHGTLGTFVDSLGMGNAIVGNGVHVEGGVKPGKWDIAFEVLANRDTEGQAYATLYRGHALRRSDSGWLFGYDQEPMMWGYGLNGGYLLGEAARPFPRLRMDTPMREIRCFGVPLGIWGFQWFTGRLENHRLLGEAVQDRSWRSQHLPENGDPQAPLLSGYRLQAQFGPAVEFYMNYTNLWSGTLKGRGMTEGYNTSEYLTAMFGLKDTLAERNAPGQPYVNKARSASNLDVGARLRARFMESMLGTDQVWFYVSRGSKGEYWSVGNFVRHPLRSVGHDVKNDFHYLFGGNFAMVWNRQLRESSPNLVVPNESAGLLIAWPKVRLGVEYSDTANDPSANYPTFLHSLYRTGFYSYGDPIGNAIGGEAITTTARLEIDFSPSLTTTTWAHVGHRPYRDHPTEWNLDHPGAQPGKDHFADLQTKLAWKVNEHTTLGGGASWQHQSAADYVRGNAHDSFRWFADLAFRWRHL